MKTLIVSLNSRYIHSSLAPWYLKAACGPECGEVKVLEATINDSAESVLASIYREQADITAFSCYIWNIGHVLKITESLKKLMPDNLIILGGPEVSFDAGEFMARNDSVDYVISGEGEKSFNLLLGRLAPLSCIPGLCYRCGGNIEVNEPAIITDFDSVSSPYTDEMLESVRNRIVYYESSRGCPFSCTYCLSSTFAGVRYLPLDRVKNELKRLVEAGVRQVKFVDRTFNCSKKRANDIFRYIITMNESLEHKSGNGNEVINFHFEAAADLFDEDMLKTLRSAPAGLIQFEIGVQTFNTASLEAVDRVTDMEMLKNNTGAIRAAGNIHIHLDLIAGLPYEDFRSFKNSFDGVYAMNPHMLQLGFLKFLKGTRITKDAAAHGYRYNDYPPYEILCSNYLSYGDLLDLKEVEKLVDRFYNSGRFVKTLYYLIHMNFASAFEFYLGFARYNMETGRMQMPAALRELYSALFDYASTFSDYDNLITVRELMKLDFLDSDNSGRLPPVMNTGWNNGRENSGPGRFRGRCFEFLKDRRNIELYLPEFAGLPAKQIFKGVHFERFLRDVTIDLPDGSKPVTLLFNYSMRNNVTGLYPYCVIDL